MSDPIWACFLFDVHEVCSQPGADILPEEEDAVTSQDPLLLQ